jgi:AcrR family transcriptional regulator
MSTSGSTLSKLRESERETRRNLILDAAVHLFATRNFNQVGMRDIAAEVGISPASIYRYFSDRDDLFLEALVRETGAIDQLFRSLRERKADFTIEDAANEFVGYLLEHDSFFQMMIHFMTDGGISEEAIARFNATQSLILDIFDELFKEIGADQNVRLLSHAFLAALDGILITFRNYPGRNAKETKKHVHRLATMMADIFKKGAS